MADITSEARALIARHDATAKASGFDRCGCADCKPFRAILEPEGRRRPPQQLVRWPPGTTQEEAEARIDKVCGCKGQHACDCVGCFNRAIVDAWTAHNAKPKEA